MTTLVKDLWAGRVPLARTFWEYVVVWNVVVAVPVLFAVLAASSAKLPPLLLGLIYFSSTPFHAFVLVALWRSASHYPGPPALAHAARAAALVWTALLVAIP